LRCHPADHQRTSTPNSRTAGLAAGAFAPGGSNTYHCLWMLGTAPCYSGVDRRVDDSSSDSSSTVRFY
jgi:hypothetical protein